MRASFFRSPPFTRDFVLWFSYHSFLPGFTLSGFPDKICGFRNLNLSELYNTKKKLWQWLEKILRARKAKRGRSKNSLYLPVIINEYKSRPQIQVPNSKGNFRLDSEKFVFEEGLISGWDWVRVATKKPNLLAGSLFSKPALPERFCSLVLLS